MHGLALFPMPLRDGRVVSAHFSKATACHHLEATFSKKTRHDLAVGCLAFGGIGSLTMALGQLPFRRGLGPSRHRFGNEALSAIAD
jgi:hypothetical protein